MKGSHGISGIFYLLLERIYKNTKDVQWMNKVHERITGYDTFSSLPTDEQWCLYHPKQIERQEKQNEYYEKI